MLSQNQVSRFHVAIAAVEAAIAVNPEVAIAAHEVTTNLQHSITKQTDFILANGKGTNTDQVARNSILLTNAYYRSGRHV
jgi:phosphoketolase